MENKIGKSQDRIRKYQQKLGKESDSNKRRILTYQIQIENLRIQIEKLRHD